MRKINFTKMVASGNDFVIIKGHQFTPPTTLGAGRSAGHQKLAKSICDRKYGVGADGLLVLEKSKIADIRMRIFNADGSEAEMCGNGARCIALYSVRKQRTDYSPPRPDSLAGRGEQIKIETKAGVIEGEVNNENVKIKLTEPKDIKLDIPLRVSNRRMKVNFINTGVPHAVIFVSGLDKIDVVSIGRQIRYHKKFSPAGTNVDFVETLGNNSLKIRTYERGVEDETLACGTGAVASAIISYKLQVISYKKINAQTKSGEILKVYFDIKNRNFKNVWLEGKAKRVYKGEYYV